jgi:hypothetical protein
MISSLNYMVATNPSHSFVVGWDGTGPSLCPIKMSTLYRSSIRILYFLRTFGSMNPHGCQTVIVPLLQNDYR